MSAASGTASAAQRQQGHESYTVQVIKLLLYALAATVLVSPVAGAAGLATMYGYAGSLTAIVLAFVLAEVAHRRAMKVRGVVVLSGAAVLIAWLGSHLFRENATLATAVGYDGALILSDVFIFGLGLLGVLFFARMLAKRSRVATVIEALLIVFSVIYTFAPHRDCHLNHPRFFADWAMTEGHAIVPLLYGAGVIVMVLSLVMFLRRPDALKTAITMVVACGAAAIVFLVIEDDRVCGAGELISFAQGQGDEEGEGGEGDEPDESDGGEGGEGGDQGGDGGGGGGGGGGGPNSDNPFDGPQEPPPPNPVAVVTFHDDFEDDDNGVLYFRQQVQSTFDQTHLTVDATGKFDRDVITTFPTDSEVAAGPGLNLDFHKKFPTSVFLLADHPQPIGLTHATSMRPLDNPNPRVFLAAYEVTSHILSTDIRRLLGRSSIPEDWTDEQRAHYLAYPDDPRYAALSDILLRDLDPRFADDALMKALVIKRYLEKEGYYTLKETHKDATDPTASFLFGSLRGYCVHFAHAAVFLFRSQGIAARVAVGYGVDTAHRAGGSNLLILGSMAHAWPEIHLDGVGWVTFDVYPEQSDEPPQQIVDQDLANVLGELAREDESGGRAADPTATPFPWGTIGLIALLLIAGFIVSLYAIKWGRRLAPRFVGPRRAHAWTLRATLDAYADIGVRRARGETRERFAARVADTTPTLAQLTMAHLRRALGGPRGDAGAADEVPTLYRQVRAEYARNVPWRTRALGALNPIGWLFTR